MERDREAFEDWGRDMIRFGGGGDVECGEVFTRFISGPREGDYQINSTQFRWDAWQAALALSDERVERMRERCARLMDDRKRVEDMAAQFGDAYLYQRCAEQIRAIPTEEGEDNG